MIAGQQCGICGNDYDPMHQCGCPKVNEAPGVRMIHERETARDIISMLKASMMVWERGEKDPCVCQGLNYAVNLIEHAYRLNTVGRND
jgi:hemerythrin-like domain-containing protein